jgi:pantothenate kinase type III
MRSLCVQFGTSRLKATLWNDAQKNLEDAWTSPMSQSADLASWANQKQADRILVSDVCGYPPLEPAMGKKAQLISHDDLRPYCDFPESDFLRVGIDRLLLTAAVKQAGLAPCFALDFGTHTTVNRISSEGKLEGGWIIPGLTVWKKNAELVSPQLEYHHAKFCFLKTSVRLFPKDSQGALLSGFIQSYTGLFQHLHDLNLSWAVTGGDRELFRSFFPRQTHEDSFWVEKGMLAVAPPRSLNE